MNKQSKSCLLKKDISHLFEYFLYFFEFLFCINIGIDVCSLKENKVALKNHIYKINELNNRIQSMINLLLCYSQANIESPTSESLFDITIGLEQLKQYSDEMKKIIAIYD